MRIKVYNNYIAYQTKSMKTALITQWRNPKTKHLQQMYCEKTYFEYIIRKLLLKLLKYCLLNGQYCSLYVIKNGIKTKEIDFYSCICTYG
jgi:hypothetical protein